MRQTVLADMTHSWERRHISGPAGQEGSQAAADEREEISGSILGSAALVAAGERSSREAPAPGTRRELW